MISQSQLSAERVEPLLNVQPCSPNEESQADVQTEFSPGVKNNKAKEATAKCEELSKLLYFVKTDWKLPAVGDKLLYMEVYKKYNPHRHQLQVVDGCVYKVNDDDRIIGGKSLGKRHLQWIVPVALRWNIMRTAHDTPDVGHPSHRAMTFKIRETMWWPNMTANIKLFTDVCDACQRAKRGLDPIQPEPKLFKYRLPNSEITIDVVEGFVVAANGWRYVVCIADSASRYVEYYGCGSNDSDSIADALVHWICNGRGFPRTIRHSQDKNIISSMIVALLRRLDITPKTQHAYAPHLIAVNERPHKELGNHIRIHTQSNPTSWHLMLPWAQYVHNTSVNRITGCTPIYLEMGNPRETMIEATYLPEVTTDQPIVDRAYEHVRFYSALSKESRAKALKYHNETIQCQQKNMEVMANADPLEVGMSVLVHLPWVSKGLNNKIADRWHGPFRIMSVSEDAYMIQDANENSETSQWLKVAKGRVRRYRTIQGELSAPERLVKRADGVKDWATPGLLQWRAELEPEPNVIDREDW
jgi:hypothetical protein